MNHQVDVFGVPGGADRDLGADRVHVLAERVVVLDQAGDVGEEAGVPIGQVSIHGDGPGHDRG